MLKTTDGFRIAEEDLRLRGGGEFFGTKQHGLPEMKIGDVVNDADVLTEVRNVGFSIVRSDPDLTSPGNKNLRWRVWSEYSKKFHLGHVA
jgi:ATP-dependent DNA helicase RecG